MKSISINDTPCTIHIARTPELGVSTLLQVGIVLRIQFCELPLSLSLPPPS